MSKSLRLPMAQLDRDDQRAKHIEYRQRYLPAQIAATRLKLLHLEREAARLGIPT